MFSRDDLGSGSGHPLVWVFAPLLLGALLISGFGVLARATQGFPNVELAEDLRLAAASGEPMLSELTDFDWDRVCVFPPSATRESVDAGLGISWGVIGGDPNGDGRPLLVFVRGDEVVTHLFLAVGVIAPPEGDGDCRAPDEESTRL
jgi:hypothetical protein